ncbi:phosphatases II [Rhizopus microsporus var. microsporus]|uniref:protein-tyrosine-phosphatase n=2 Tax=Rhizopus microsporus TaxID=58291 RepID=A0A2G4SL79_RHIZD|nr:phosphatases II [Rhizopus microsporus ATCC 52813]ORE09048.1 phosphatases II [Rhizopus microsporus var. microsporus]PHZ09519.1 phosphatases II [Rhizopus microsporus ATCC 52813]
MSIIPTQSDLFQTLENGLDGKPGGILITSIGEQITDYIWLGGFRTLESREFLEDNQIKHVLSLGHFKRCKPPIEVNHKIIAVKDDPEAHLIQHFPEAIEFISNAVSKREHVLVHCLAGVSRSPAILAAYLMATENWTVEEALANIQKARPFINPNRGFLNQLQLFQQMKCHFDEKHPAYIKYLKEHPIDTSHLGHEKSEYESSCN